jgi:hypothetical protein
MPWLGTIEDPDVSLTQGLSDTPLRGYLLLNGSVPYSGSRTLNKPMTIGAYEFATRLGQ